MVGVTHGENVAPMQPPHNRAIIKSFLVKDTQAHARAVSPCSPTTYIARIRFHSQRQLSHLHCFLSSRTFGCTPRQGDSLNQQSRPNPLQHDHRLTRGGGEWGGTQGDLPRVRPQRIMSLPQPLHLRAQSVGQARVGGRRKRGR